MDWFVVVGTVPDFRGSEFSLPVDNSDALLAWWRSNGINTTLHKVGDKPSIKIRGSLAAKCSPDRKIRHTIEVFQRRDQRCIRGVKVEAL